MSRGNGIFSSSSITNSNKTIFLVAAHEPMDMHMRTNGTVPSTSPGGYPVLVHTCTSIEYQ
jgi:hypothetical protein